jgi:ferredoxin-NADP reductase
LVATGTGVTPYRAMLGSIKKILSNQTIEFILLLGVRNFNELLYAEDFIKFADLNPNFKFIACYSREKLNDTSNFINYNNKIRPINEYFGYVQNKLTELNIQKQTDLIYLCGNPNMIDESITILKAFNISRNKIKREKYISSK